MFGIINDDNLEGEKKTKWEKKQDALDYAEDREKERAIKQAIKYLKTHGDIADVVRCAAEMVGGNLARLKLEPDIELRALKKHQLDLKEVFTETLETFRVAYERMVEVETIMKIESQALQEEKDQETFLLYQSDDPPLVPDKQEIIDSIKAD